MGDEDGARRPAFATATLAEFVKDAGYARLRSGTVADLLDRWMGQASPAWSSMTVVQTRSVVEHHLKPQLGHLRANKLTTTDIDAVYLHLLRSGGRDGSPLAPGTVHRIHAVLHRALTQAVRWEWIWLNPAANASPPRVAPAEIRPPTPDQLQRLVASVEASDPDFATYLWLAASTGARRSQMLGLRWADIDFPHSAIGFSRAYVDGPVGPVLRATKTHRTYRVAVDDESMLRLVDHYRRAMDRGSGAVRGQAFVFTAAADGGAPWLPNRVTKTFIGHRRRAGVGEFRLHDLRHFMATQMLAHGVAVVTVAQTRTARPLVYVTLGTVYARSDVFLGIFDGLAGEPVDVIVTIGRHGDAGAGLRLLPREVSPDAIRAGLRRLLEEPSFTNSAIKLSNEIADMPPPPAAVSTLQRLVQRRIV